MNQDRIFHKAIAFFLDNLFTAMATVAMFAILNGLVLLKTKSGLMTGVRLQN